MTIAPACPIRLPGGAAGDEREYRLGHAGGVVRRFLFLAAADLADDDHRVGTVVPVQAFEGVARGRARDRIAADADESGLAVPGAQDIEADEGAEAAAARYHPDPSRPEDAGVECGHDADEALARRRGMTLSGWPSRGGPGPLAILQ